MSDIQVWAVLLSTPAAPMFGWSIITRKADSTHWEVFIGGVDEPKARLTADALNGQAERPSPMQ